MKNLLPIYLIEDEQGQYYVEKIEEVVGLEIEVSGTSYIPEVILLETWGEAENLLSQPEILRRGGIVIADGALNAYGRDNTETFSLKLLFDLREKLKLNRFPFSICLYTAHEGRKFHYLAETYRNHLKEELYHTTLSKMGFDDLEFEEQFKEYLNYFKENYREVNGCWYHKSVSWKKNFEASYDCSNSNSNPTIIKLANILAINFLKGNSGYIVYHATNEGEIKSSKFSYIKNEEREELESIVNKFDPALVTNLPHIFRAIEKAPIGFVKTHADFIVNMLHFKKCETKLLGRLSRKQNYPDMKAIAIYEMEKKNYEIARMKDFSRRLEIMDERIRQIESSIPETVNSNEIVVSFDKVKISEKRILELEKSIREIKINEKSILEIKKKIRELKNSIPEMEKDNNAKSTSPEYHALVRLVLGEHVLFIPLSGGRVQVNIEGLPDGIKYVELRLKFIEDSFSAWGNEYERIRKSLFR